MIDLLCNLPSYLPYLAILATLVVSGLGVPIPEEVTVITAGILSSHGQLRPWLTFAACWSGALIGDCLVYFVGYHFGKNVVREHRLWACLVTPDREAHMEETIHKHGLKVLFVARFLVGVRSAIYLAAGVLHVPFRRFVLVDLLAATTVVGLFFWASCNYGVRIAAWLRGAQFLFSIVAVLLAVTLAILLWCRHRKKVRARARGPE